MKQADGQVSKPLYTTCSGGADRTSCERCALAFALDLLWLRLLLDLPLAPERRRCHHVERLKVGHVDDLNAGLLIRILLLVTDTRLAVLGQLV